MCRLIWCRNLLLALIGVFGLAPIAFGASNTGTLTIGSALVCNHQVTGGIEVLYGFSSDSSVGTISARIARPV